MILEKYKEILDKSRNRILELGNDVLTAYELYMEAFKDNDITKADEARKLLKNSHNKNSKIDNEILKTLALFSPEAKDLRVLIAHLKIASELTRISDYIQSAAKNTKMQLASEISIEELKNDTTLYMKSAKKSLQFAIESIQMTSEENLEELNRKINVEESKCDDIHSLLEHSIIQQICILPENATDYISFLKNMRKLGRISDRSLNIVTLSYFAIKGGKLKL